MFYTWFMTPRKWATAPPRWTAKEISFLKKNYSSVPVKELMKKLNRTRDAIHHKARSLGLRKYNLFWTQEQIEFLKLHYGGTPKKELIKKLGKTWYSIQCKAKKLGIKRWDPTVFTKSEIPKIKLTNFDLGFIVGFIEAEGTIFISVSHRKDYPDKIYYYPQISICNTNPLLIRRCQKILGMGGVTVQRRPQKKHHKPIFLYSIGRLRDIYRVLKTIEPHLITKKRQAQLVMEFIELRNKIRKAWSKGADGKYEATNYTQRQVEIVKELKQLNKRGL